MLAVDRSSSRRRGVSLSELALAEPRRSLDRPTRRELLDLVASREPVRSGPTSIELLDLASADITLHDPTPLLPRAWDLRTSLTPYDAVYVALAEVLDATLVTADARIARAPGVRTNVDVVLTA